MEIENLACPSCGAGLPDNISRGKLFKCANCGSTLVWPERQATISIRFGLFLCPECGTDNEQSRKYCRLCGTLLLKKCPICGDDFYVGDNYCPNGHNFDLEKKRLQEKERLEQEKIKAERSTPPPAPRPVNKEPQTQNRKMILILLGIFIFTCGFIAILVNASKNNNGSNQKNNSAVTWSFATQIANEFSTQNATASREDLENEISDFIKDPGSIVTVQRVGEKESDGYYYGIYEIINNSKYSWVTTDSDCVSCPFLEIYRSTALPTSTYMRQGELQLLPGGSRQLRIQEYRGAGLNWNAEDVCIWIYLSNQVSSDHSKICFNPVIKMDLSQYLNYSARTINSSSPDYSGLVEVTFNVDDAIPYYPIMLAGQYLYQYSITFEPSNYNPNDLGLYQPDSNDSRVLVGSDNLELLPGTTQRFIYLYDHFIPENICISFSAPYAEELKLCSPVNR